MTEPRLVLKIRKALEAEGHYVAKIHGGRYSVGVPDLLVCRDGQFIALEVKLPGKEKNVTDLQSKNLRAIRAADGCAWVVTSMEGAVGVCRTLPRTAGKELVYECD